MEKTDFLNGLKVVEFATYMAAPISGKWFAEYGAEVIKVDSINGDPLRNYGSIQGMSVTDEENVVWQFTNAGKKGIALNVKSEEGMAVLHKLLAEADVFVTNFRPKVLERLGLTYADLCEKYPRLIYANVSGYGDKGPWKDDPGFDGVSFFARSGFMVDMGTPGQPTYSPGTQGDVMVGTILFGGIMMALLNREKTGKGDEIGISLFGTALNAMTLSIMCASYYGYVYPKAKGDMYPLSYVYTCKDGVSLMPAIVDYVNGFPKFCKAINREEWIDNPRWANRSEMVKHKLEFIELIEEAMLEKDSEEWLKIFNEYGLVVTKMGRFKDMAENEHGLAAGYLVPYDFGGRVMNVPGNMLQYRSRGLQQMKPAPLEAEHTAPVLESLGYSEEEIAKLAEAGVVKVR